MDGSPRPAPPRIELAGWLGLRTHYLKEVRRFLKVPAQTVTGPAVTTLLFLVVFNVALGGRAAGGRRGLRTHSLKEVRRFLKVPAQTVTGPAVTTLLFLVVFNVALGGRRPDVAGVPLVDFLAPGLLMMAMAQNAFANTSSSLL